MKKRLMALTMLVVMLISLIPSAAIVQAAEATTYTLTINARSGNRALRYVQVTVDRILANDTTETVDTVTTNNSGRATISVPDGDYHVHVAYTSGDYVYIGSAEVTVNGGNTSVTIDADSVMSWDAAEDIYDETTYFNHVDIRVNGSFTVQETDPQTGKTQIVTYDIKLSNPTIRVDNPTGTYSDVTASFHTSVTYEWNKPSIRVHKDAVVYLICDITYDGDTIEDFEISFSGKDDFIQAIINCDINTGLDFIVDAQEIMEAVFYGVSYQWSGLPDEFASAVLLPGSSTGYAEGSNHPLDTQYVEGEYVIDYTNRVLYEFQGWETYTTEEDNHTDHTDIEDNDTHVTVNHNTIVYGVWEEVPLEDFMDPIGYITIKKAFGPVHPTEANGLYIRITDPQGHIADVDYTLIVAAGDTGYKVPVYLSGDYTVTEYNADVDGYARVTTVTATKSSNASMSSETFGVKSYDAATNTATVEVTLPDDGADEIEVGTVLFTNTYEKKTDPSKNIHHYPNLIIHKFNQDSIVLAGAGFTLTPQNGTAIVSPLTDESGYTIFTSLKPGVYTLSESTVPSGYKTDSAVHVVTVEVASVTEEYDAESDAFVSIYYYKISVTVDGQPSQHFNTANGYRLSLYNEAVDGTLTVSKTFAAGSAFNASNLPAGAEIKANVTGPNGYSETVTLSAANNWSVTLSDLEMGTYTVVEDVNAAKVNGYTLTTTYSATEVELTHTENEKSVVITNSYEKNVGNTVHNLPELTILKVDGADGASLEGATFKLEATGSVFNGTSDANGKVVFSDIPVGTYTLTEVTAPTGYKTSATVYTVTVTQTGSTESYDQASNSYVTTYSYSLTVTGGAAADYDGAINTLTVKNEKITASLTVEKNFGTDSDLNASNLPAGTEIKVNVTGPNGYSEIVTLNASNNWSVTLSGLEMGVYTVAEDANAAKVDGYTLSTSYTASSVTFAYDDTEATVVVTNTYEKNVGNAIHNFPGLTILKVDGADGTTLKGAAFKLESASNVFNGTSDANGKVVFSGVPVGTYTLTEVTAPAGYKASATVYTVTVTQTGSTESYDQASNSYITTYSYAIDVTVSGNATADYSAADGTLTVENELLKTGSLTVTNEAEFWMDGVEIANPGSGYEAASYSYTVTIGGKVYNFTLAVGESKTFSGIVYGTEYSVVQNVPAGSAWTVSMTNNASGQMAEDAIRVDVLNKYEYAAGSALFQLIKVGAEDGRPLFNAQFTLYADAGLLFRLGTYHSDRSGYLSISFDKVGTYYLKETKAPVDYIRDDTVHAITVSSAYELDVSGETPVIRAVLTAATSKLPVYSAANGNTVYKFSNTLIPTVMMDLTVTKVWVGEGPHPASVEVALYKNGEFYKTTVLSAANGWTHTWNLNAFYDWTVDEVVVPEGYEKSISVSGNKVTITNTAIVEEQPDDPEQPDNPDVPDEPVVPTYIEVTVKKVWEVIGNEATPDSVKVTLFKDGVAVETVTLSAANGWSYTWAQLDDAYTWTVDEAGVPVGYVKTVERDGNTFIITNSSLDMPPQTGDNVMALVAAALISAGTAGVAFAASKSRKKNRK